MVFWGSFLYQFFMTSLLVLSSCNNWFIYAFLWTDIASCSRVLYCCACLMDNLGYDKDLVVAITSIIYLQLHVSGFIFSNECYSFAIKPSLYI